MDVDGEGWTWEWALDGKGKGDRIQLLGRVVEFFLVVSTV